MTEPAGNLSKMLSNLRTLVAASSTFQTWTGSADATEALDHVYYLTAPKNASKPLAMVSLTPMPSEYFKMHAAGTSNKMHIKSRMLLTVVDDLNTPADPADSYVHYLNHVGGVLDDMTTLAAQGGYLAVTGVDLLEAPWLLHKDEQAQLGDIFRSKWLLEVGP